MEVEKSLLAPQDDGSWRLPFSFRDLDTGDEAQTRIPVVEERVEIGKRQVDTGGVRVVKSVSSRTETVDVPLQQDDLVIERIPAGRLLDAGAERDAAKARQEGDVLIVPVLEEVLVVEKRWRLKEEVRITRRQQVSHAPQTVTLRSESVTIERLGASGAASDGGARGMEAQVVPAATEAGES